MRKFSDVGVSVAIDDNFLKVKETLTRIGIFSSKKESLYQSCHILHKGQYKIVHFKELFLLDGKEASLTKTDIDRRDFIANLLDIWGLVRIVEDSFDFNVVQSWNLDTFGLTVLPFNEKNKIKLVEKYKVGKKKYGY